MLLAMLLLSSTLDFTRITITSEASQQNVSDQPALFFKQGFVPGLKVLESSLARPVQA